MFYVSCHGEYGDIIMGCQPDYDPFLSTKVHGEGIGWGLSN